MAVNRTTQLAMTTALGIFVILSFALGIMSYIFASRQFDAEAERDEARQQAADAQMQLTTAKTEQEELRKIIGVDAETPVADIDTRLTEQFSSFPQKEKSYAKLVELLQDANRKTAEEKLADEREKDAAI
ncbi:MAG: hypothetical protein NZ658_01350, partial [Pirellulales bacterium]|nr:hypothetical protein [Pirellulales bacterium]